MGRPECKRVWPTMANVRAKGTLIQAMRRGRVYGLLVAALVCLAGAASAHAPALLKSVSGLWQFGNNLVWIRIDVDGSAFQCRIARGGTVYSSAGVFVAPGAIQWRDIWGKDQVSLRAGRLRLDGVYGAYEYHRTSKPMDGVCVVAGRRVDIAT